MGKKRSNGEGSIRQRPNGSWQASVMIGYRSDGKRNVRYFSGKSQSAVRKKMTDYINAKESGLLVDNEYTLSEWSDIFLAIHKSNIKPVTYENYKYTLRIIKDHLGDMQIAAIKPIHVELFLKDLLETGRSDSAITQCRGLLYMIMDKAEANDLIRKNPVRYATKTRKRPPNKKDCFTDEEIRLLMQHLPDDRIGWSIRLLLATGIRTQELLAMMPKHIAPDGSSIIIEQAVSMVRGTATISTPKSYDSYRTVPIPENARYCAIKLRKIDADYIWSVGDPSKPANPSTFRTAYKKALTAIPGVRYLSPHSCRHTYVSTLQSLGVDMATIQSLVGHSTLLMTNHYLHVHPSVLADAVSKFAKAFPTETTVSDPLNK